MRMLMVMVDVLAELLIVLMDLTDGWTGIDMMDITRKIVIT